MKTNNKGTWIVVGLIAVAIVVLFATTATNQNPKQIQQTTQTKQELPETKPSIDDGIYEIGNDIQPGKYKTAGGENCYYARLGSLDSSDIISNHFGPGPKVVQVKKTDVAFESSGCGSWKLVK